MTISTADAYEVLTLRDTLPQADAYFIRDSTGEARRHAQLIEELISMSHDENSLDWDTLDRMEDDGWSVAELGE